MMIIDGKELTEFSVNNKRLKYGFKDGKLLWGTLVLINLTVQVDGANLTTFINNWLADNNHPSNVPVLLTNTLNQPSLVTGNLTGIGAVEFVNNGTISGTNAGYDALTIQAPITLTNNGSIRGAGGNGGNSGNGGVGGKGGKGADIAGTSGYGPFTNWIYDPYNTYWGIPFLGGSFWHVEWGTTDKYYSTVAASSPLNHADGYQYEQGTPGDANGDGSIGHNMRLHKIRRRAIVVSPALIGGAGGPGGAGESIETGGKGASFNTDLTSGSSGTGGSTGTAGSPSSPTGGYSGGKGGTGGSAGTSGNGGDYGANGENGTNGGNGGPGYDGGGNPNSGLSGKTPTITRTLGQSAGEGIVGAAFLHADSVTGNATSVIN